MSEIKPVYQAKRFDDAGWTDVTQESYKNCELAQTVLETRILYPAAAYEAQAKRIAELEQKEKVLDRLINEFEGKHKFVGTRRVHKKLPLDLGRMESAATMCAEHVDVFQWVFRSNGEPSFKQAVMNLLTAKNGDSK